MKAGTSPVVEETVVRLAAGGIPMFEWRCTPVDLQAIVIGRLYMEGLIDDASVADALTIDREDEEITITIAIALRGSNTRRPRSERASLPTPYAFAELFRALFAKVDERYEHGGMHAAALAVNDSIAFQAEDVGRHNAVDKVMGMALLDDADIARHGMLVSSRISGEIAHKAARGGVAWLASRSIPTTLAVRTAQHANLPVIGRAAGRHAVLYT